MLSELSYITLVVADVAKSREFYQSIFGWFDFKLINEHLVFFNFASGPRLALSTYQELRNELNLPTLNNEKLSSFLSHNTDLKIEVDDIYEQALICGGRSIKSPSLSSWGGWSAVFCDLDDNVWEIVYKSMEAT